jgi:diguanylate cyclase (GGDEF)-like protein
LAVDNPISQETPQLRSDSEVDLEVLARAEHLRIIFKNSLIVLLANLSAGVTLTVGLWPAVPRHRLLLWLAVLGLFHGARWVVTRSLPRTPPDVATVRQQEIVLLAVTALSGLLWGSAAILFYVPHDPAPSVFLALVLVAMTAASTALLSFHRLAYPVFLAPVVIPLGVQLAVDDGAAQTAIALVIPVYFFLLFVLSRQIYRFTHAAIVTALTRERHALVDHLTAIPNRRAFEEFLDREWSRGVRTKRPLTLILADIDDFKAYNDGYGHAVGDSILRAVAGLFRQAARRGTDLPARLGGDEFALLAPETDRLGASSLVLNIMHNRDLVARNTYKAWPFPTLSFGLCTVIPSGAGSPFELFEEADTALYEAKAAGRNRVADCMEKRAAVLHPGANAAPSWTARSIPEPSPRHAESAPGAPGPDDALGRR